MDSCDDSDVIMMIKRSSIQGYPIKDACSNTELVVMTTFDGCVYTCDPRDANKPENYVKMIFPTSREGGELNVDIVNVCCGRYHFLALSRDGHVYSWGKNTVRQLGIPLKKMKHKKQKQPTEDFIPRLIKELSDYDVIQIACGDDHSLALTRDGRLFSWGCNGRGQLGVETEGRTKRAKNHAEKPVEINSLSGVPWKHIAAGGAHSVALSTSGSVFVWGRNAHGQLGLQEAEDVKLPVKLGSMSQGNVQDISCGSHHTSFLKQNGKLLVYGMGVDRHPCESDDWRESELRPGEPDEFCRFSYIQSTSHCTYAVNESTGGIFVIKHDTVQTGNFHLVPLEEGSITDLFEPVLQTDWPPGHYAFDPKVWEPSRPVEDFQPLLEETRRGDVPEVDELGMIEEQEGATAEDNSDDSVDGTTKANDIAEHGRISDGADDGFDGDAGGEDFIDCTDDAYSDNDSFVTCDEDYVSTVSEDSPVDLELRATHIDEQEDMSRNHVDSDETSPKCTSPLAQNHQHTSSREQIPSSNESLSRKDTSCLGIERAPTDTDTTAAERNSPTSEPKLPQSHTYPTVATNVAGSVTPDTADTALCASALDESFLHVRGSVSVEDGTEDPAAPLDAASITGGHDCPHGETVVDESGEVLQESSQRPPRTWRRMCTGLENIFIIEHDEPVGEQVHFSITRRREIDTISVELLQSLSDITKDFTKDSRFQLASMVFSSPACINASFQQTGPHEVNGLNVDLKAARRAFEMIGENKKLLERLSKVITGDLCSSVPQSTPHEEALRFYFILMECPIFSNPGRGWSRRALAAVAKLMGFLGNASPTEEMSTNATTLAWWWKCEPMSFRRVIVAYREALTFLISERTLVEREQDHFWTYLKVLRSLNEVNIQNDILSIKTFYIPKLDKVDYQPCQYDGRYPPSLMNFSWTLYPFLIDLELKTQLFESGNIMQQQVESCAMIERAHLSQMIMMLHDRSVVLASLVARMLGVEVPTSAAAEIAEQPLKDLRYLHLTVDRDDVFGRTVREQLAEMLKFTKSNLLLPLRVTFEGENGVDEGGLSKEFFRLVFEELMDPEKNNILRYINDLDPTHSSVWFRKYCDNSEVAKICGLLFGLSLYNKAIVPLPFPQLLYAKLLGKGPRSEMEEVAELDKKYADQMSKLLNGSEDYVMGCCDGEEIELEDGRSVEVTKENVHLYVEKMVREYLVPSQFKAFQEGFERVFDPANLEMFRPIELEALVMGEKYFDWNALEQSTRYVEPYRDSHSTIRIFWKVFHALDDDMKRKFLVFVSASDRVPVGGLRNLGLHIGLLPVPMDDNESCSPEERLTKLLPQGHTCDNNGYRLTLRLPMYNSCELMEDRLLVALSHCDCPFHNT